MNARDLFEAEADPALAGFLNVDTLRSLLPTVDNPRDFASGINKLRMGQDDGMTMPERQQLAQAFISLIKIDPSRKMMVMRLIASIKQNPQANTQQQSAQVTQQGGGTTGMA